MGAGKRAPAYQLLAQSGPGLSALRIEFLAQPLDTREYSHDKLEL